MHLIKAIAKKIVPYPYHFYLGRQRRAAVKNKSRQDIVHFALAPNAYLEVFWKIFGIGRGPAVSLFIEGEEVLKFDFYGRAAGHYHIQLMTPAPYSKKARQLFMPEETVEAQIDRAMFELDKNLYWYLERHPLKAVRDFTVNKKHLRQALEQVRSQLLQYQAKVPVAAK